MAKVTGVTLPSDLNDTDVASEANFFNPVYESLEALDAAVGKMEPLHNSSTDITISNTTETNMATFSVPAGALGTANIIKIKIFGRAKSDGTGDVDFTLRLKYGGTTICSCTGYIEGDTGKDNTFILDAIMSEQGTTSLQVGVLQAYGPNFGIGINQVPTGDTGTGSEDSTGILTLSVTAQLASAIGDIIVYYSEATLIDIS